jgi:inorganic pyrophosphatase
MAGRIACPGLKRDIIRYYGGMNVKVFVQNEAGSNRKNIHNEKTLEYIRAETVTGVYPYPYGFILNTTSGDEDNLDCFIITEKPLKTGQVVDCEPLGIMEQTEDDQVDNNIIAVLTDERADGEKFLNDELKARLTEFAMHAFDHIEGKKMSVGRFLGKEEAARHILECLDST